MGVILWVLVSYSVIGFASLVLFPWVAYWFSENYYRRELHNRWSYFRHVLVPIWLYLLAVILLLGLTAVGFFVFEVV